MSRYTAVVYGSDRNITRSPINRTHDAQIVQGKTPSSSSFFSRAVSVIIFKRPDHHSALLVSRMPILPLSASTARRLGSASTISSPVLLLKELLENAVDSCATAIDIFVSLNTVDILEVRDNGDGICVSDLDFLGRPGYTSKLRSFEHLSTLVGSTLGFRGAALASANGVAHVSLTTRTRSEPVGTTVVLADGGGVARRSHAAAPVGTSVCVTGLFSQLPVRLQVAVKEAPKTLLMMKALLQSYALARPRIRLRFTVLKNPDLAWSYAPPPDADVREAAVQLFGTYLASQFSFEIFPDEGRRAKVVIETTTPGVSESSPGEDAGFVFEALLPKPGADLRKVNKGLFLSVDSRPISPARRTARSLIGLFKRRVGDHHSWSCCGDVPRDLFLRLNIRCPPGSYDVNIEPSKDDILFKEEKRLLVLFECFLSSVYPPTGDTDSFRAPVLAAAADREAFCDGSHSSAAQVS